MTPLDWAVAFWLGGGLTAFSAWAVRVWATKERPGFRANPAGWIVFRVGEGLVWLATLLLAGAVFGGAATVAAKLIIT